MDPTKKTAKIAGAIYLIVILTGIFSLAYVPSKLITWGNPSATSTTILAGETLFRLGILAGIICYTAFLFLPLILYQLLHKVNKKYALLMVVLAVVSVPISLINLTNKLAVLTLLSKADYLNVIPNAQLQTQVLLQLDYYNNGIQIASIFWGLWLFPFGYLVVKSGFLPKILGMFLMAGCFGYLLNFMGRLLYTNYNELGIASFVALPATLGEIGICLWFLIIGIKHKDATLTTTLPNDR